MKEGGIVSTIMSWICPNFIKDGFNYFYGQN